MSHSVSAGTLPFEWRLNHHPVVKDMEKVGIALMDKYNVPEDERRYVLPVTSQPRCC